MSAHANQRRKYETGESEGVRVRHTHVRLLAKILLWLGRLPGTVGQCNEPRPQAPFLPWRRKSMNCSQEMSGNLIIYKHWKNHLALLLRLAFIVLVVVVGGAAL